MKIVVSFENRIRPDSTGVYFVNAFRELGHEVNHVLPDDIGSVHGGHDLYVKIDDGLKDQKWNPELHPSAYYVIDTHIETDWRVKFANDGKFDAVSVAQKGGLSLPWDVEAAWIPLGCDPSIHNVGRRDKEFDVAFIGNFHTQYANRRLHAVDRAFRGAKTLFFGNRTFKEMTEIYSKSRIVFNCALNQDINMRVFEALCSGSCLLTDHIPEMKEIGLLKDVHYYCYNDLEEITPFVQGLLANEEAREEIAKEGQEIAMAHHTYKHRAQDIINNVMYSKKKEVIPCQL